MTRQQTQPLPPVFSPSPGTSGEGRGEGSAPHAAPPWPRLLIIPAAFLLGSLAEYTLAQDAFWPMLAGGAIAAASVALSDLALTRLPGAIRRHIKLAQILTLLVLSLAVALFYRSERNSAFASAFGTSLPTGLSHTNIERLIAQDTHRKLVVVQFETPRAGLDALIAARKFTQDLKAAVKPGKEAKAQRLLWVRAFSRYGQSVEDRWKTRLPVLDPVIYHWTGTDRETLGEQTSILWDAASGRGCAIHSSP